MNMYMQILCGGILLVLYMYVVSRGGAYVWETRELPVLRSFCDGRDKPRKASSLMSAAFHAKHSNNLPPLKRNGH